MQSSQWLSIAVGHMSYVAADEEKPKTPEAVPKSEHINAVDDDATASPSAPADSSSAAADGSASTAAASSASATRPKPPVSRVSNQRVTLLYRLVEGACPHSFGFNAARLAGLSEQVVHTGFLKARELERLELVKQIRYVMSS